MWKKCCSPESPAIDSLSPEEKQRFGRLVHRLRKSGRDLKKAQEMAFQVVLVEQIGNKREMN